MLDVISTTSVVFMLMGIGYVAVVLAVLTAADLAALGKFVVSIALPGLILQALISRDLSEIFDLAYIGAYLFGSLAAFAIGYVVSRRVLGMSSAASTFQAMGMSCSNSGYVGYPILAMALPSAAAIAFALDVVVENTVMIPLMLLLAERAGHSEAKGMVLVRIIARRLFTSPIVLSLIIGLAISLMHVPLPGPVTKSVSVVSASSVAVALVVIGGTLYGLKPGAFDPGVALVVAGKLLLHPFLVFLGFEGLATVGIVPNDPLLLKAGIVMAGSPAMTMYPIFAQRYGQQERAAQAMLAMTLLSFFTISAALYLIPD
ncbi:AEC family transporter [Consotaella salsifontis]|uniref:Permease n=1 Tax=Consotaella salsifontis TaxID=1365950 RepID=A0A1T4LC04_9HYPH|nr:AEC family transporter [Consotaella salsifontis]SJZ52078.1 hypothetical protein SAMN05428963_101147 [Consotaella salsifontis]